MIVRRNYKEFKNVVEILNRASEDPKLKSKIETFIVKSGEQVDKRISTLTLSKDENQFYSDLNFENIISNINNPDIQLHRTEDDNPIYYFRNSNNKTWDQTPFQFHQKALSSAVTTTKKAKPTKAKEKPKSKPAISHKEKSKKIEAPKSSFQKSAIVKTPPKTTEIKSETKPKIKLPFKENVLDHQIEFHYLQKTLFPDAGIKKADVLAYYYRIHRTILPYLKDRPQYFRWHRGSINESNYNKSLRSLQQDWKGKLPEWIPRTRIFTKKYQEKVDYMLCQDLDSLMFLIEIGCIELSPWHSVKDHAEYPDYIVMDLDPLEIDFSLVTEVALMYKYILDNLDIPSYVKTSGSKGLHIYIPLDRKSNYETGRLLSELLSRMVHFKLPSITSLERDPAKRRGKVYLDCLQNAMGKSIAAPYCIRPNKHAGVATPLEWSEVNSRLQIEDYNFFTIEKRLERIKDPFKNLFSKKINGEKVLKTLKETYDFLL